MSATMLSEPSEPSTPEIAVRTRRGDLEGVRELLEESVGSARRHRAANIESSDGLPVLCFLYHRKSKQTRGWWWETVATYDKNRARPCWA